MSVLLSFSIDLFFNSVRSQHLHLALMFTGIGQVRVAFTISTRSLTSPHNYSL